MATQKNVRCLPGGKSQEWTAAPQFWAHGSGFNWGRWSKTDWKFKTAGYGGVDCRGAGLENVVCMTHFPFWGSESQL